MLQILSFERISYRFKLDRNWLHMIEKIFFLASVRTNTNDLAKLKPFQYFNWFFISQFSAEKNFCLT